MFNFLRRSRRPVLHIEGHRRVRPALEDLEGRLLLEARPMAKPTAGVATLSEARGSGIRIDTTVEPPGTLLELGQTAIKLAGKRASKPKIVHEVVGLLLAEIGFNLGRSLYNGTTPAASDLEYAFEHPHSSGTGFGSGSGFDCITLSEMAKLALKEVDVSGELDISKNIRVNTYIPAPGDPTKAVEGALLSPAWKSAGYGGTLIENPANPSEYEMLFDRSNNNGPNGAPNSFEATVVYTDPHDGKAYYFPGGTNYVYRSPDKVLTIFKSLGWEDPATGMEDPPAVYAYAKGAYKYKQAPSIFNTQLPHLR